MKEQFQTEINVLAPGKTCNDGSESTKPVATCFGTRVQCGMFKSSVIRLLERPCTAAI